MNATAWQMRYTIGMPLLAVALWAATGCGTIRRLAVRNVAATFTAGDGGNVFLRDDDPELIRDALPFGLKTYEAMLNVDPGNSDLQVATASGFIQYANGFIEAEARRIEAKDFREAKRLKQRAARLYLRGRDYALRGLELEYPDFEKRLRKSPRQAVSELDELDVPLIFWAGAGWAGAISVEPGNMDRLAELPLVEALMRRGLELDEDYSNGAFHEFFLVFEGGRSEAMGGSPEKARKHFERAVELTGGKQASPYVAYASTVAVSNQDYELFKKLLDKALAIDADAVPELTLINKIAQRKARWLLDHRDELFLDYEEGE